MVAAAARRRPSHPVLFSAAPSARRCSAGAFLTLAPFSKYIRAAALENARSYISARERERVFEKSAHGVWYILKNPVVRSSSVARLIGEPLATKH